jgi:peptidoglycan/LPS O-acetylase OafA/YrhL
MSGTSYSVYLFHGFFLAIVGSRIGHAVRDSGGSLAMGAGLIWLAVAPLTYGFAYVIWKCVEIPGIEVGAKLTRYVPPESSRRRSTPRMRRD